jgi:hypothetical protein
VPVCGEHLLQLLLWLCLVFGQLLLHTLCNIPVALVEFNYTIKLLQYSVVDPNSFFSHSDSDPKFFFRIRFRFRIRIRILIFWTEFFFKWCLSLLSFVCWNLYDREKSFPTEKNTFFCLSSVWSAIFHNCFLFYNSVWIRIRTFFRIRIQPNYSDYFGFGSTTLLQTIRYFAINSSLYKLYRYWFE